MHNLATLIANACVARANCIRTGNHVYERLWDDHLDRLRTHLPSGSGIDSGTRIDRDATNDRQIVLLVDYHHMNEAGFYAGWVTYKVTAKATLLERFDVDVHVVSDSTGEDEYLLSLIEDEGIDIDGTCEYLADVFSEALSAEAEAA